MIDKKKIYIEGMTCASCVTRVEKSLAQVPGVVSVNVNLASESALVQWDSNQTAESQLATSLVQATEKAGYMARLEKPIQDVQSRLQGQSDASSIQVSISKEALILGISILLCIPLILPMILMSLGIHWMLSNWMQFLLAAPIQFIFGFKFYKSAWKALKNRSGNMELLVVLGTTAAFALSVFSPEHPYYESSAVVITLVMLGKYLEGRAKRKTTEALRALESLRPTEASVVVGSEIKKILIEQIQRNDIVLVKPGERIPVDGQITSGNSQVDESHLTGESIPVEKTVSAKVHAGSINGEGVLYVQVTALGSETMLSKIISMVEEAQGAKAPIQKIVDQVASVFVPVVVAIAVITFVGWYIYLMNSVGVADAFEVSLIHAVSVLVIACPCALGLATPTALMVGMGLAAQRGILIRDAESLELAHNLKAIAFDKTGTLTEGHPSVVKFQSVSEKTVADWSEHQSLRVIHQLQSLNEHPLAKSSVLFANKKGAGLSESSNMATVKNFQIHPGKGVSGEISGVNSGETGNKKYWIVSDAFLQSKVQDAASSSRSSSDKSSKELSATINVVQIANEFNAIREQAFNQGQSLAWLVTEKSNAWVVLAVLVFEDQLKKSALSLIQGLKKMNIQPVMITGDNQRTASKMAQQLELEEFYAEVLPHQKAEIISKLKQRYTHVGMVGDGVNDAPALAMADVGIAMSTGTDVAMSTAGITLMRTQLSLVQDAIEISKRTYRKILQNLFWASIFNVVGIPLAAFGQLSPVLAGSAMALSSVSVVTSALLLKRKFKTAE